MTRLDLPGQGRRKVLLYPAQHPSCGPTLLRTTRTAPHPSSGDPFSRFQSDLLSQISLSKSGPGLGEALHHSNLEADDSREVMLTPIQMIVHHRTNPSGRETMD